MKKTISFSLIIFCFSIFTDAQTIRFGVDPGIAISRGLYKPFLGERRVYGGFDGGAFVQIGAQRAKFQAEINYSMIGVELNNGSYEVTVKHRYLTIPLMIKVPFARINLLTGPQVGFLLASIRDTAYNHHTADIKDEFKSSDFAWVFGGEIKITKNIFLGIRYTLGLTNISDNPNFEMKNRYTSFRLGYLF